MQRVDFVDTLRARCRTSFCNTPYFSTDFYNLVENSSANQEESTAKLYKILTAALIALFSLCYNENILSR